MSKFPILILLVDDEKDFIEFLSLRLTDLGHRVQTAFSGKEGLDILDNELPEPDVVILDIKMPGLNGIETLKLIKHDHPLMEVILLTGHGAIDTAVEGLKAGAFDYLQKPADFNELLTILDAARHKKWEQEERIRAAEARALVRRTGDI